MILKCDFTRYTHQILGQIGAVSSLVLRFLLIYEEKEDPVKSVEQSFLELDFVVQNYAGGSYGVAKGIRLVISGSNILSSFYKLTITNGKNSQTVTNTHFICLTYE